MKTRDIKMTERPILPSVIRFVIPLAIGGIMQSLYNAADLIVIGQFAGETATAAIGANSAIIALLVHTFIGLSVGADIILARSLGAKDERRASSTVHTSFLFSIFLGLALTAVGELLAEPFLRLTGCPEEAFSGAVVYLRICLIGAPAIIFYNFMSVALRAKGDTLRPLIYLTVSGVANVLLNLFFVVVLGIDVAGVAIATVVSQYISAFLVFLRLLRLEDCCRLVPAKARIHIAELKKIIRYGVPSAVNSSLFSITNIMIQSSINAFGVIGTSGNTASGNIEGFVSAAVVCFGNAAATFVAQNIGAGKPERVIRIMRTVYLSVTVVSAIITVPMLIFGKQLLGIYLPSSPEAVDFGYVRFSFLVGLTVVNGLMQVNSGIMRAFGYTFYQMLISVIGVCGFRVFWNFAVYPHFLTPFCLYLCYGVSWSLVGIIGFITVLFIVRNYKKRGAAEL